jgi:DNA-binding MarR family transcriptional regulator
MKEIADFIHRNKSTITYLINSLTKEGYVIREKSNEDSRETYIVLTPKAWEIQDKIMSISRELISTAYRGMTEEEQLKLLELLNKMDENFPE